MPGPRALIWSVQLVPVAWPIFEFIFEMPRRGFEKGALSWPG